MAYFKGYTLIVCSISKDAVHLLQSCLVQYIQKRLTVIAHFASKCIKSINLKIWLYPQAQFIFKIYQR